MVSSRETARAVLDELRASGVHTSIDDFGTGYSSFAHLANLPLDELKIDRSFIQQLDAGDDVIVRSMLDIARNLGLRVVAEGVETELTARRLRELDCDVAQGFLYSPGIPSGEVAPLVRRLLPQYR